MDYKNIYQTLKQKDQDYLLDSEDELTEEFAHFYFIGNTESEVVFDAVLYTLQMEYNSELYEAAEEKASIRFPKFSKLTEESSLELNKDEEEEIGLFMAEVMIELEEQDEIKVTEHIDEDDGTAGVVILDIGLNLESINKKEILNFIESYRSKSILLDKTYYSFQSEE